MADFSLLYAKEVHKNYGEYYANWLPENPISLGDIGTLKNDVLFERISNLKNNDFQIKFSALPSTVQLPVPGTKQNHYKFITGKGSTHRILAKGEAGLANGGVEILLSGENSLFFNLAGIVVQQIDDQIKLSKQIIELYKQKKWNKGWRVITSIIHTSSAIILGSNTGKKSIILEAKSAVPEIELQNANIQFATSIHNNLDYEMVCSTGVIPLFKTSRVKPKLFGKPAFGFAEEETDLDEIRDAALSEEADLNDILELSEDY